MRREFLRILIKKKFGDYITAPDDYRVNCIFCIKRKKSKDTEHKLYLSWSKDFYHCFRCDTSGKLENLFEDKIYNFEEEKEDLSLEKETFRKEIEIRNVEPIPENSVLLTYLPPNHPAIIYAKSRGVIFPKESLFCENYIREKYKGEFVYSKYGSRIIFPIFINGIYQGFQARTITDHPIKYVNSEGFIKSKIIYNWDRAKHSSVLVVVEGIIDSIKTGLDKSVAIFGKSLSKFQRDLIMYNRFDKIIIMLDRDAFINTKKIAKELSLFHNNIWYVKIKCKDPGSTPSDELNNLLNSQLSDWKNNGLQRAF